MINYYEFLNIHKDAKEKEIKLAYRKLVNKFHPDRYQGEDGHENMVLLNEIKDTLLNTEKRFEYDQQLASFKSFKERREREAHQRAERETKERREWEAHQRAERETKERREWEAHQRAERETKERREWEAHQRAEREAKVRREREARQKAEREAKERREQEAHQRAEREAKERREQEAHQRAEREAKERSIQDIKNKIFFKIIGLFALMVVLYVFYINSGKQPTSTVVSVAETQNRACLNQFYKGIPPILDKDTLKKDTYALCFNGFNVLYSGISRTPLWSAEYLSPERLSKKIKHDEDSFHEEMQIPELHRSLFSDYNGSGHDHMQMSPSGDMSDVGANYDSFSLANTVPQATQNNQQVWRELEEATRAMVTKQKKDIYVVTGPIFSGKRLKTIGSGVIVPTAVFKAIYIPKQGIIGAYYSRNNDSQQVKIVSVCYLEEQVGMNLFPQLTEEQKRNTYKLPLTANQVKANKEIEYSHWDTESQCAQDSSSELKSATQKQFTL